MFLDSLHREPWTFYERAELEEETGTKDDLREKKRAELRKA